MFTGGSPGGRGPRGRCRSPSTVDDRQRRGAPGRRPGPGPRSWSEPPGSSASRVRRSRSARVWSRFLRARSAFSCRASIWCSARPRAASAARAQGRIERAQGLLDRPMLALDRLARAREGRLDLGVGLARPARDAAPRGRPAGPPSVSPSASSARACAGSTRVRLGRGQERRPRDAEVRVGRADLRVVGDLGRSADVGRGGQQRSPGPAAAAARPGSRPPGRASRRRTASSTGSALARPAHLDRAVLEAPARAARPPRPRTGSGSPVAPAPAGGSPPRAAPRRPRGRGARWASPREARAPAPAPSAASARGRGVEDDELGQERGRRGARRRPRAWRRAR